MYKRHKKHFAASIMTVISMSIANGGAFAGGLLNIDFNLASFSAPTSINNPYWPLNPDGASRTFTYVGETEDECVIDQISVNNGLPLGDTYTLNGVAPYNGLIALQVLDTEWVFEDFLVCDLSLLPADDSAIKEKTLDRYMQDDQQNIWYMGEYSQSFDDEVFNEGAVDEFNCANISFDPTGIMVPPECKGGSWEAGVVHELDPGGPPGEAGIVVPSDEPIAGEPLTNGTYYLQEVAFEAEDMAKILKRHTSLAVEDDDYENCRKVKEWNPFEHGGSVEHKWYCKDGDGLVLIEGIGGGPTEVEVLVDVSPPL